jgi:mRNA-degrading endonuclease toxin of MazEF toxin-antitoxin module
MWLTKASAAFWRLRPVAADQQSQMEASQGMCGCPQRLTSLPKDSVANVSLIVALDKRQLVERVGKIPRRQLEVVLSGIDVIVGR